MDVATSVSNTDNAAVVLTLLPIHQTGVDRDTARKNSRLLEDKLGVRPASSNMDRSLTEANGRAPSGAQLHGGRACKRQAEEGAELPSGRTLHEMVRLLRLSQRCVHPSGVQVPEGQSLLRADWPGAALKGHGSMGLRRWQSPASTRASAWIVLCATGLSVYGQFSMSHGVVSRSGAAKRFQSHKSDPGSDHGGRQVRARRKGVRC